MLNKEYILQSDVEIRRDIEKHIAAEWMYQVSNFWRVRNWTYYKKRTHILKPECWPTTSFYWDVKLKRNWKFTRCKVHRLVAWAFLWIDYFDSTKFVCHKDDVRNNNNLNNLFVWTQRDNIIDMWRKWRWVVPWQKLNVKEVIEIKVALKKKVKLKILADKYWCTISTISYIKSWKTRGYI